MSGQSTNLVEEAMRIVQEHLDREARNRQLGTLAPRELCPDQKAALVRDLAALLAEPVSGSSRGRLGRWGGFSRFFNWLVRAR